MRAQLKFAVRGLSVFIGLAVLYGWSERQTPHGSREPASREPAAEIPGPRGPAPRDGKTLTYRFKRHIKADLQTDSNQKPMVNLMIDGKVWLNELSSEGDLTLVSLQYALKEANSEEIHYSHLPFLVELTNSLKIKSIKSVTPLNQSDEDEINLLRDFISLYAYGSDTDTSGAYIFKLKAEDEKFIKTKLRYTSNELKNVEISNSLYVGKLDRFTLAPLRIEGREEVRVSSSKLSFLQTVSSCLIERITAELPEHPVQFTSLEGLKELNLKAESSNQFKVQDWSALKLQLDQIAKLTKAQRLVLFHELTKLLKTKPEFVASFQATIENQFKEPGLFTFGIGVLATAGNDEAQAVLRNWTTQFPESIHTVLNAFATSDANLNSDTRKFLMSQVSDAKDPGVSQNAAFALGSALKKTNDEEARLQLLELYRRAEGERDRLSALDAMGNSGDIGFLVALKKSMKSESPAEREKATFAFRFMRADLASPFLLKAFRDPAAQVKSASIRALQYQDNLTPYASLIEECATAGINECKQLLTR